MTISADQCRAARGLIDWSQDDLEAHSKVAKRTIAEFERGGAIPYERTLTQLREALEVAGVTFIPENGGGAGVRRERAVPRLGRKKVSRFDDLVTLIVNYRGSDYTVEVPADIYDDMSGIVDDSDSALNASVDSHMNKVLLRAARAIDAGRAGDKKHIVLTVADFSGA